MKKTTRKTSYTSPEVELLVVHSEGGILNASNNIYGGSGEAGGEIEPGNSYNL